VGCFESFELYARVTGNRVVRDSVRFAPLINQLSEAGISVLAVLNPKHDLRLRRDVHGITSLLRACIDNFSTRARWPRDFPDICRGPEHMTMMGGAVISARRSEPDGSGVRLDGRVPTLEAPRPFTLTSWGKGKGLSCGFAAALATSRRRISVFYDKFLQVVIK